MPTVHRAHGLRFVIFTDDHEPAHIHAVGGGGEAKIDLGLAGQAPKLIWVRGLSNAEVRRAMAEVAKEGDRLLEAWTRIHGRIEP
jgi:hypothetical protein